MPVPKPRFNSFAEFWPYYLGLHRRPQTRAFHYAGLGLAALCLGAAFITGSWLWALLAGAAGYGLTWVGHGLAEGNRPATFAYPVWSFLADLRMAGLALTGRLKSELARYGIE